MDKKLLLLASTFGRIDRSAAEKLTATDIDEIEKAQEMLEKEYEIKPKESNDTLPASPTPPLYLYQDSPHISAMICCNPKDGKARRRERRAQERMKKKQNKRY